MPPTLTVQDKILDVDLAQSPRHATARFPGNIQFTEFGALVCGETSSRTVF